MPTQFTVFDYWYDATTNTFEQWSKSPYLSADMMDYDPAIPMASVTVPTPETCSVTYWMKLLVNMRRPVMLAGPAGTGKTQIVYGMLAGFDPQDFLSSSINFNFYTTSAVLQNTMGIPLVKKTGTNYGPPGQAKLVYFIDDINLPEVDPYNTQSAIALLRQHLEYEHVYDLSKLTQKNIEEVIQFIEDNHGVTRARAKALSIIIEAKSKIESIPESPAKQSLLNFADYVIERTK